MDKKSISNILILAESGANAEQIVNLVRKSGRSVFARNAANNAELLELIGQHPWDLLFLLMDGVADLPIDILAVLRESDTDIPALLLLNNAVPADQYPNLASGIKAVLTVNDPDDLAQQAKLNRYVQRELENLHERRERRRAVAALRDLEQRYRLLLASASDAISYLHDGVHVYANAAYMNLFGYDSVEEMISVPLLDLVAIDDKRAVKAFLRSQFDMDSRICAFQAMRKDGSSFNASMDAAVVPYEGERALQLLIHPATGNTRLKNTIRQIHNRNLLTGLLNRASLLTQIEHALGDAVYEQKHSALLLLQLQHLDEVSVVMGKSATNLLLADVGDLLLKLLPADVLAGRLSTSEFGILIPNSETRDSNWPERLLGAVNNGLRPLVPQTLHLYAVAGSAAVTEEAMDAEVVVERARYNISARQNQERNRGQHAAALDIRPNEILLGLRQALSAGNFALAFQPVVNLKADGLEHYEIRIRMPKQSSTETPLLFPPDFLEIANQHGLGEDIDRWVLAQAMDLLQLRNNSRLRFTVNLTKNSITGSTLLPWLAARLHELRQPTEQLILQVSELDIISTPQKGVDFGKQLAELNIRLSITHFGCSLDPFLHLDSVQAHFVKLDRALLQDLDVDVKQRVKLQATVKGLHARGLLVIAPMMDQIEMLPLLWQADLNMLQGNCLQEPSDNMDFSFMQDEEITLRSFA
jgi:multidomain signaling protein FimX